MYFLTKLANGSIKVFNHSLNYWPNSFENRGTYSRILTSERSFLKCSLNAFNVSLFALYLYITYEYM